MHISVLVFSVVRVLQQARGRYWGVHHEVLVIFAYRHFDAPRAANLRSHAQLNAITASKMPFWGDIRIAEYSDLSPGEMSTGDVHVRTELDARSRSATLTAISRQPSFAVPPHHATAFRRPRYPQGRASVVPFYLECR